MLSFVRVLVRSYGGCPVGPVRIHFEQLQLPLYNVPKQFCIALYQLPLAAQYVTMSVGPYVRTSQKFKETHEHF